MHVSLNLAVDPYTVYIPQGRIANLATSLGWGGYSSDSVNEDVLRPLLDAHLKVVCPTGNFYDDTKLQASNDKWARQCRDGWRERAGGVGSLAAERVQHALEKREGGLAIEAFESLVGAARERVARDPVVQDKLQKLYKLRLFNAVGV